MSEPLVNGWLWNIFSKGGRGVDAQAGLRLIASSPLCLSSTGVMSLSHLVQIRRHTLNHNAIIKSRGLDEVGTNLTRPGGIGLKASTSGETWAVWDLESQG